MDEADRQVGALNPKPWGHGTGLRELGNAQIGTGSAGVSRIRHGRSTTLPLQCFDIASTRRSTPGRETACHVDIWQRESSACVSCDLRG